MGNSSAPRGKRRVGWPRRSGLVRGGEARVVEDVAAHDLDGAGDQHEDLRTQSPESGALGL